MKKILENKYTFLFLIPFLILICVLVVSFLFSSGTPEEEKKELSREPLGKQPVISVKFQNEVRTVNLEEYLVGVVAGEMPPSFELEALKAQAVAARTYIISKINEENSVHPDADVCTDPSHCKAYISDVDAYEKWGNEWKEIYEAKISDAVYSTFGEIVTYNNEPIVAVFHSTSTGRTENSEDVWQDELPYLKSVESDGEELSPRYKSTVEYSVDEFKFKLKEYDDSVNFSDSPEKWIQGYEYTEGGAVRFVKIGGVKIKGTKMREIFSLRSATFTIEIADKVIFNVTGNGHGVGMSQYGANYAASEGADYKEILLKYYTGTDISKKY